MYKTDIFNFFKDIYNYNKLLGTWQITMIRQSLDLLELGANNSFYCLEQYRDLLTSKPIVNGQRHILINQGISTDPYFKFDAEEIFSTIGSTLKKVKKGDFQELTEDIFSRLENIYQKTSSAIGNGEADLKNMAFGILTVSSLNMLTCKILISDTAQTSISLKS